MNRDKNLCRGRRAAPADSGSGASPESKQPEGGQTDPKGGIRKGNWFVRHKVLSIIMVSVLAVLLAAAGFIVNALADPFAGLVNRNTPDVIPTPSSTDWTDFAAETDEPADTDAPATATPNPGPTDPGEVFTEDIINILVLGTDADAQRIKKGMNARTDCIMLCSINRKTKAVSLISFPRDIYVKIYNAKNKAYARNRINTAFTFGGGLKKNGIPFAVNTVSQFLSGGKIPIDHYVLFDMDLVRKLIDAVGKVTVDVEIDAKINGVQFKKGPMELNGWAAIQYARDRHNTAGGDVGRVGHQQQVMIALLKKLKDTNTILTKIPELYTAFTENITTDLSFEQIAKLAFIAKDIDIGAIKQYTITGEFLTVNSSSMIVASQTKKQEIVKEVFGLDVPIDSSWTKAKLQKEIEAKLSAGKDIVNTASNYLSSNAGYYTADEAAELQSAISTWRKYSQKNDPDNAADAAQDVQAQYDALKQIVEARKQAVQKGRDSISWAQGKLSELSAYISDADKSTINGLIAAVQACVDAKDYNGVGGPKDNLVNTATPIFNAAEAARGPAQTATPAPADAPSASAPT